VTKLQALRALCEKQVIRATNNGVPICFTEDRGFVFKSQGWWIPFGFNMKANSYELVETPHADATGDEDTGPQR
jgi:hypothetical protein